MIKTGFTAQSMPKELKRMMAASKKAVILGLRNGARGGRAVLVERTPKDTGQLKASWRDTAYRAGRNTHEVFNDAPHAGIVEEGARPHAVSAEGRIALREWVDRHFPSAQEKERDAIVEGICWKILRYGQAPTHFVRNSLPLLRRLATEEVVRAVNAAHRSRT